MDFGFPVGLSTVPILHNQGDAWENSLLCSMAGWSKPAFYVSFSLLNLCMVVSTLAMDLAKAVQYHADTLHAK